MFRTKAWTAIAHVEEEWSSGCGSGYEDDEEQPLDDTMATLGRLKRGSLQLQRAAIKATGRVGVRTLMALLVALALLLQGLVQHSASVVLSLTLDDVMTSEEFAEYVANTSYVTRYCQAFVEVNDTDDDYANFTDDATDFPFSSEFSLTTLVPIANDTDATDATNVTDFTYSVTDPVTEAPVTTEMPYYGMDDGLGDAVSFFEDVVERNASTRRGRHRPRPRHILNEPDMKVPMTEQDSKEALVREAWLWGTVAAPLPAAHLAARVGPTRAAALAAAASAILIALVPFAWFSSFHIVLRLLQGFCAGAIWPSLHMLGVQWYPPLQRTGYVSLYAAVALGQALAGLLCGPLVQSAGRNVLCYVLSLATALWLLCWLNVVSDSPAAHKRMPVDQRRRLHAALGPHVAAPGEPLPPLPWRHLLTSWPVWACAVANAGGQWGQAALQLALTKYLQLVYGYALTYDRLLWILPPTGLFVTSLLLGRLADHARTKAVVSTTTARKMLVYFSHFPAGAILFVVGYSGCDPAAPPLIYSLAVVTTGATAAGVHASAMDLAPNYAGTVFAFSQTLGALGGLLGSYVVTEALHGSLPGSWRLVFGVAAFVLAISALLFLAYGSGSPQPWNDGAPSPPASVDVSPDAAAPAALVEEHEEEPRAGPSTEATPTPSPRPSDSDAATPTPPPPASPATPATPASDTASASASRFSSAATLAASPLSDGVSEAVV